MLTRILTTTAIAAAIILAGPVAANAENRYPPENACTASPTSIGQGDTSVITCEPDTFGSEVDVQLTVTGPGVQPGTIAFISFAAATQTTTIVKTSAADGSVSATFTAPTAASGTYIITAADADVSRSASVTVTAASAAALPSTGGTVPVAALWIGIGAIGIGGIAVAAAAARRRAHHGR